MKRFFALVAVITLLSATATRAQQSWDISTLAGYVPTTELEHQARGVESTSLGDGFAFQFAFGRNFNPRLGAEVTWGEQFSSYRVASFAETGTLFKMSIMQVQGNLLVNLTGSGSRIQPYALVGFGGTFFSARDLDAEQKFSLGLGGGVKWFFLDDVAMRAQVRYRSTFLNDSQSDFCDPFGFCQSTLRQFEFMGGATFRF